MRLEAIIGIANVLSVSIDLIPRRKVVKWASISVATGIKERDAFIKSNGSVCLLNLKEACFRNSTKCVAENKVRS